MSSTSIRSLKCITALALSIIWLSIGMPVDCSSVMKSLYEDLFTDYNRLILPVSKNKTKVTVTLGLKLGQILDLNLKQQILSTNVWVEQTWLDNRLEWNPDNYQGIDMIHVPAENIWIPDIVLFNNADGNYELTLVAKARVYSNGTVVWKPPTMFRSTCEIDVEYFPFDIQTCYLRFGSWTYAGDEMELRHVANERKVNIGIDLSQFYKNVEWDIIDVPAYYNEVHYVCCQEPYPDITFKIVIRRKMLFYLVNLILPVALMTFMTVSVFYLPSDSKEKVTLSISILTSLIVFFLLMLEIIPASSLAVPLFGKYLLFTLVLVSLSACVSVYVLNIHHRSPSIHVMSPTLRRIFLTELPRLLRLDRPDPRERSSLNRFRKKKLAQQMLEAPKYAANKVYDLSQPLQASLNLIETLHKSYNFDPKDDLDDPSSDDQGRYFRRYVDNYIERMKEVQESQQQLASCNCNKLNSCCEHLKCCSEANQPLQVHSMNRATGCCGLMTAKAKPDWADISADLMCPLVGGSKMSSLGDQQSSCKQCAGDRSAASLSQHRILNQNQTSTGYNTSCGCTAHRSNIGLFNDDTLNITFDYDDQPDELAAPNGFVDAPKGYNKSSTLNKLNGSRDRPESSCFELPSPPPPPKQLAQLNDSMQNRSGRLSSCSKNVALNDSDQSSSFESSTGIDHGQLVDKLINSINLINNNSDEVDTTLTSNNDFDKDQLLDQQNKAQTLRKPFDSDSSSSTFCSMQQHMIGHKLPSASFDRASPLVMSNKSQVSDNGFIQYTKSVNNFGLPQHLAKQTSSSTGMQDTTVSLEPKNNQKSGCTCSSMNSHNNDEHQHESHLSQTTTAQAHLRPDNTQKPPRVAVSEPKKPSDLLLSLRLPYDQMPAHVRAAIRSVLFIADTIKNEDDENSAIEDWESMSMVVDRLFLWIFFILCTFGSIIILALAPSLYDQRASIDDKLRIDIPPSNCSASVYGHQ